MRCHKCGHSAETDEMYVNTATDFYKRVATQLDICPNCKQKSYALSAYT